MFDSVASWLTGTDFPATEETIVGLLGLIDRARAALDRAVARFDDERAWASTGAPSMLSSLRNRGLSGTSAAALAIEARRLQWLPAVSKSFSEGALSGGQVSAVLANLEDDTIGLFAESESELVPSLVPLMVAQTAHAMQCWRSGAEATIGREARERRDIYLSRLPDGSGLVKGVLDSDSRVLFETALRAADVVDPANPGRTPSRRRGDALLEVCRSYLAMADAACTGNRRPNLQIVVDVEALLGNPLARKEYTDGTVLSRQRLEELSCDSVIERLVMAGRSTVLDHGRQTYTVPPVLRRALVGRDGHCRAAGCDRPPYWCEAHHRQHWIRGGPTKLENLVLLLCSYHHHLVHQPGWRMTLREDRTVMFTHDPGTEPRPPP